MNCLDCQASNYETALTCVECGHSLRPARANLYLDYAEQHMNKGQFANARASIVRADAEMLTLSPAQRDCYLLAARAFWLQGTMYYSSGAMSDAKQELLLAKRGLEGNEAGRQLLADVLNKLGNISYYAEDYDMAISYYQQSSELAIAVGAHGVASKAVSNIGIIYNHRGDIVNTEKYYLAGMDQAELAGDATSIAGAARSLADFYANYGPASRAVEYATKTLVAATQMTSLEPRSMAIAEAAGAFAKAGQLERAVHHLHEAYEMVRSSGDHVAEGTVATNIAEVLRQTQDAQQWYAQALKELYSYTGAVPWSRERAYHLAIYYASVNNRSQMRLHLQWLKDNERQGQLSGPLISHALAILYTALGEYGWAESSYEQALADVTAPYDIATMSQEYANMLLRWAEVYADVALYQRARLLLEQAADIYRRMEIPRRAVPIEATIRALHQLEGVVQ